MSEIFTGYSIEFGYSSGQTLDMNQVDSMTTSPNSEHTPFVPAGGITPAAWLVPKVQPEGTFTTQDLATFFGAVDVSTGLLCNEESTFALSKRVQGGGGLSAANNTDHYTWTAQLGQLFPESISAEADSNQGAQLNARFIALSNGTLAPFVFQGSQAINAITAPGYNSSFALASPYHNSVEIQGCRSINLDFGAQYRSAANTPDTYNDCVVKVTQQPVFRFTVAKADEFAAQALVGEAVNTSFAFYLQRIDATNGGRIAATTGSHFKLSFTAGKIARSDISASGIDDGTVEFMVHPVGALTVSLASQIGG